MYQKNLHMNQTKSYKEPMMSIYTPLYAQLYNSSNNQLNRLAEEDTF